MWSRWRSSGLGLRDPEHATNITLYKKNVWGLISMNQRKKLITLKQKRNISFWRKITPQYPTCLYSRCTFLPFTTISFFKPYCLEFPWLPTMNWNCCVIYFISSQNCALAVSFEQLKETGYKVDLTKASKPMGGKMCWGFWAPWFWLTRCISIITDIA